MQGIMLRLFIGAVVLGLAAPQISAAAMQQGCGHDCGQCHTLSEKEAKQLLASQGKLAVLDIKIAPAKGLWQVLTEREQGKQIFYIDFGKQHLLLGDIVRVKGQENLTKEAVERTIKVNVAEFAYSEAFLIGNPKAGRRITVLTDPHCSFCVKLHGVLKQIVKQRNDIAFQLVLYPMLGPKSVASATTILCNNSLAQLEASYAGQPVAGASCIQGKKGVERNLTVGRKASIRSVPTIVFENGRVFFGTAEKDHLLKLIEENRKR